MPCLLRVALCTSFTIGIQSGDPLASSATSPITPSGLHTEVSDPLMVNHHLSYTITGGTRLGHNLFHSFGTFNVPTDTIANFYNETSLPTDTILARVTGGNISHIQGMIQTTDFAGAHLILMNPAGIVFGPTATLDVGGAVTFTTADYIRLADHNRFNAMANVTADALLSASPVAAFGFLGTTGAITVQGSRMAVAEQQSLSFIGGDITIGAGLNEQGSPQAAQISAPGGQIHLAGVASRGEILAPTLVTQPSTTMGSIKVAGGSTITVSDERAGTIRIRGGQLTIADGTLAANTGNQDGASRAIDIQVTGDMSITKSSSAPSITAWSTGTGHSGGVFIQSGNLTVANNYNSAPTFAPHAVVDTHAEGTGRGGDITIVTQSLAVNNLTIPRSNGFMFIESGIRGGGQGGNVMITAKDITLDTTTISTGGLFGTALGLQPTGSAGNLLITADHLRGTNFIFDTGAVGQKCGDITLQIHDLSVKDSQISTSGFARSGSITLTGLDHLLADYTSFESWGISGTGGAITVSGRSIDLINGSYFATAMFGNGNAGNISLMASDHVTLSEESSSHQNPQSQFSLTGLFSGAIGIPGFGQPGSAGDIFVSTPKLVMDSGGRINALTSSSGHGGNITIHADDVQISGEFKGSFANLGGLVPFFGNFRPSGIFAGTMGDSQSCAGPCGVGGNIDITARSLVLADGGQVNSDSSTAGHAGNITIHATDTISLSGMLRDGSSGGILSQTTSTAPDAGSGGNISLTAGQSISVTNGAVISASSEGPGNAGNISIHAGRQFDVRNGSVTTSAHHATGGNIDITATDLVRVVNGQISTSVLCGSGNSGNISIDPNTVVLQNSQIMANASAGNGGNITITTPLLLADQSSRINASSQFGMNGTVTIQSPTANLSGTVGQLTSTPSQVQLLLQSRCAALADGQQSTFILSGRQTLPTTAGGWVGSPTLLAMETGEPLGVRSEEPKIGLFPASENDILSLRRLTPPGFLVRSFANDGATGCRL